MAKVEILAPFLLSFEGGFVNDPMDKGGATNKGVTLSTWRSVGCDKDLDGDIDIDDLRLISDDDVISRVLKPYYWDAVKADLIVDQSVANMIADWAYNSGAVTAAKQIQRLVGVTADGKIGTQSLSAINRLNPQTLFNSLKNARLAFLNGIVARKPDQQRFLKGWTRRVESIQYRRLVLNNGSIRQF